MPRVLPAAVIFAFTLSAQSTQVGKTLFRGVSLPYRVMFGHAIAEGDIDLGPVEALPEMQPQSSIAPPLPKSVYIGAQQYRWPNGVVPYVIDGDIPNQQRVLDAIAAWNTQAPVHLMPRGSEANYVHFIRQQSSGTCFSSIGMTGNGEQFIRTDDLCNANGLTHEIGHTLGLYHENSRADRDFYLTVDFSKVDKRRIGDESIKVPSAIDGGGFDYGSIMEYTRYEASQDRQLVVLETIPAGMPIDGSAHGLSAGDLDRVARMYGAPPSTTTIDTNPTGLQVIVDGETVTGPKAFNWAPGSTHTVDAPDRQGDGTPTRYLFGRWSDHGARQHTITASSDITVFAASFVRQYLLRTGVNPASGGTMTATPSSPDGYYNEATQITVQASPAPGFRFSGWNGLIYTTLDGWGQTSSTFRLGSSGINYTANFTTSALVTVTTDPANLPVTINGTRASGPRNLAVNQALNVSAEATISFGTSVTRYVFQGWSDGGAAAHTIPASTPGGTVITAKFTVQHLVSTAFTGRGAITVTPSSTDGYYDHGTTVQITAAPASGYQLMKWSGDLSGGQLSQSIDVNQQVYAQAEFIQPFTLNGASVLNAASFLGGAVSPGEILTIFGMSIGPATLITEQIQNGKFTSTLGGVRVLFDGVAAPLVYVSPNQIAPIVPYTVAGKNSTIMQLELN
ncbi:MAG TPA: M12 family metallopeptidase, partial [Candidatus Solibacter sp.]|nr:M12 family metallopeptidase [Candidatus Solibacter sp.]